MIVTDFDCEFILSLQVFDLSKVSPITASPSPDHPPHVTLHTSEPPGSTCWVEPRCLATGSISSPDISLWDVGTHLDSRTQGRRSALYDQRNIYTPTRTFSNEAPPLCMGVANDLFITGDREGCIRVLDPKGGKLLQTFRDHKGRVTDLYVDRFRVLSCSVDFSIRVYRWVQAAGVRPGGTTAQLESRYTLLGGSVALRQQLVLSFPLYNYTTLTLFACPFAPPFPSLFLAQFCWFCLLYHLFFPPFFTPPTHSVFLLLSFIFFPYFSSLTPFLCFPL